MARGFDSSTYLPIFINLNIFFYYKMIILDKKQYYQGLHRSGWSYVMIGIQMMKFDFPLIFDPIVDL